MDSQALPVVPSFSGRPLKGGSAVAKNIQRRLATILAADVVGYSRLMGENEVGTLDALLAHRRLSSYTAASPWPDGLAAGQTKKCVERPSPR